MSAPDQTLIAVPQREVQLLLGKCVLRLQQYEILLKSVMASSAFSGTPDTIQRTMELRKAEAGGKTLGILTRRLFGEYIRKDGSNFPNETSDKDSEPFFFSFRSCLHLPEESHVALKEDTSALVALRNRLVHHFIELHDISTVDGCLLAQEALHRSYADIDRQFEQLRTLADHLNEARRAAAELMQSPEVAEMMINGILPDGQVHWPGAGIVYALRRACRELSVEGWANLEAAAHWVAEREPEQTPKKYGCSTWRQAVHESGQFELRRFTHNGKSGRWFRERASVP